jgi:hypothetical protein
VINLQNGVFQLLVLAMVLFFSPLRDVTLPAARENIGKRIAVALPSQMLEGQLARGSEITSVPVGHPIALAGIWGGNG